MGSWHLLIWNEIMERIHSGLEYRDFEVPTSVVQASICTQSGLLATSSCPAVTEYYAADSLPTEHCAGHVVVRPTTPETTDPGTGGGTTTDPGTGGGTTTDPGTGGGTTTDPGTGGGTTPDPGTGGGTTTDPGTGGGGDTGGGDTGGGDTGGGDSGGGGGEQTG